VEQRNHHQSEQLSLLEKVTENAQSKISLILFTSICIIDHSSRWVAGFLNPRTPGLLEGSPEYRIIEEVYFYTLFAFDSLKKFLVSILSYLFMRKVFSTQPFFIWLSFSWMSLNGADFLDNLIGYQNNMDSLDVLSLCVILYSLLKNVIFRHSNPFRRSVNIKYDKD